MAHFLKTTSKNFDDFKLDTSRIKKIRQTDNLDDIAIDKKRYAQRHSKDTPPLGIASDDPAVRVTDDPCDCTSDDPADRVSDDPVASVSFYCVPQMIHSHVSDDCVSVNPVVVVSAECVLNKSIAYFPSTNTETSREIFGAPDPLIQQSDNSQHNCSSENL